VIVLWRALEGENIDRRSILCKRPRAPTNGVARAVFDDGWWFRGYCRGCCHDGCQRLFRADRVARQNAQTKAPLEQEARHDLTRAAGGPRDQSQGLWSG